MLQVQSSQRKAHRAPAAPSRPTAQPPIMSGTVEHHPIFGPAAKVPGFSLERQHLSMLNHWHLKAIEESDDYWSKPPKNKPDDDPHYDVIYKAKWDIFEAAFKASIASLYDVAQLLEIAARHAKDAGDIEGIFTSERLQAVSDTVTKAARPEQPTKYPRLAHGRKLTRAGMLQVYAAFLYQELETVGWNVWGNPKLALQCRWHSSAVDKKCRPTSKRGVRSYPFFDERKLTARARAVLKALKINAEKTER